MKLILKQHPHLINHSLKVVSLIFGYLFWAILAQNQNAQININIPIYFYGLKNNLEIESQENLKVKIEGRRSDLCKLDLKQLAAHFDISHIDNVGEYKIDVQKADLFLHKKFKLIEYSPQIITIQIKEKK